MDGATAKKFYHNKTCLIPALICLAMVIGVMLTECNVNGKSDRENGVAWFRRESKAFIVTAVALKKAVDVINTDTLSVEQARKALRECRLQYKRLAFFLEYFFPEEAMLCNGPPQSEVENTSQEYRDPVGLQVIEALLYTGNPVDKKEAMAMQADLLARSAYNILPLLSNFHVADKELLASLDIELVRIMTLYITGYDAPLLKSGITEAYVALSAIDSVLTPYLKNFAQKDSLAYYLSGGRQYLQGHSDFDTFNRLFFITGYALPIQEYLNQLVNTTAGGQTVFPVLNSRAKNLFSPDAFNKAAFPGMEGADSLLTRLGKELFFEKALSVDYSRNCATCHSPAAAFTDGLPRNKTIDNRAELPRNTPSLLYAGFQYAQFWDGRSGSLEDQAGAVLNNRHEMGASEAVIVERLRGNVRYPGAFRQIWPDVEAVTFKHVTVALSAYVATLAPFQSAFDHYIQGNHAAMSAAEQRGFNLFMGKAQCGACHFAPLFNGLLPPDYRSTEFEVLGTPADDNLEKPRADTDQGRHVFFPITQYVGAFKTPTVRNAAVTAPYMHNGRFGSLEKVIDFYDKGGGAGLGIKVPNQTLSDVPLHLGAQEKSDLLAFIKALTDK